MDGVLHFFIGNPRGVKSNVIPQAGGKNVGALGDVGNLVLPIGDVHRRASLSLKLELPLFGR